MSPETSAIIWSALGSLIRHGLTAASGVLVTIGWVAPVEKTHFIDISTGIVLGLLSVLWSIWQKRSQQKEVKVLKKEAADNLITQWPVHLA